MATADPAVVRELEALERALAGFVRTELSQVAYEFNRSVRGSTELTAAVFRVSAIRGMWRARVPALMRRVLAVAQAGVDRTLRRTGGRRGLPAGWDNLTSPSAMPEELRDWYDATLAQLNGVGDTLAEEAVRELTEGLNAGEDQRQLEARMIAAFNRNSYNMGQDRAQRISATQTTGAWNAGALGVAQAVAGPDRQLSKTWVTRHDDKVRSSHAGVDGQTVALDEAFDLGVVRMQFPGDPTAPADQIINCRCILQVGVADTVASVAAPERTIVEEEFQSRMPEQLKRYWLAGPGAARIGWGTPGAFKRCVSALHDDFPEDTEGLCANLYHEATGRWPGQNSGKVDTYQEGNAVQLDPQTEGAVPWGGAGTSVMAVENVQTGDGRGFAPGALYWQGDGPWPLMYCDEMGEGHAGAKLAGAIQSYSRNGSAVFGAGVIYPNTDAGEESARLLAQGAPLGVSVDLDDVSFEVVAASPDDGQSARIDEAYNGQLVTASLMQLPDGGFTLIGRTATGWTASGMSMAGESATVTFMSGPDGSVPGGAFTAAAGDPVMGGTVQDQTISGEYFMRITRARVRGATLVPMPAFADARIVLDASPYALAAAAQPATQTTEGTGVKLDRGPSAHTDQTADKELTAAVIGSTDLPVAPRDHAWDGPGAESRVFDWANGDTGKIARAFVYRNDDADPTTKAAYKLGVADVLDGTLALIPRGVFAAEAAVNGARGGVDIPADQMDAVKSKLKAMRNHVDDETGANDKMAASAWTAMRDLPPMPADWFREPTVEELPPGGAGVNYSNGRIFGWVAQAGEPHAGHAKKITIDTLGRIDTTHFLRQRFTLDDGSTVKAGAFTMGVGHHRDGAECETAACQFDDSRTVAGIVTVGMNERGMWFSGAASPWLSDWDRTVFLGLQPSYHMRQGGNGGWQLRAVLSVPVPGHSSPLLASAVIERGNLALTAAAMMVEVDDAVASIERANAANTASSEALPDVEGGLVAALDYDRLADSLVAAMARADQRKMDEAEALAALIAEAQSLTASGYDDTTIETDQGA